MFHEILQQSPNLTIHRYFRLLFMAVIEICCTIPICSLLLYHDYATSPLYPYKGLADLHLGFSRVRQYPLEIWIQWSGLGSSFIIQNWLFILCALVYFLIFGLTEEARRHYVSGFTVVARILHITPNATNSET